MSEDLKKRIDVMKTELNALFDRNASYEEIYALSRKLDVLINLYIDETQN